MSDVSPHTLRRTFGSHLLNHGLRLEVVSKPLGHTTTTITEQSYAQLLDYTTRRELLHALNHERPQPRATLNRNRKTLSALDLDHTPLLDRDRIRSERRHTLPRLIRSLLRLEDCHR